MSHLSYRRDIDGLRALAIISVVFYHAGVPGVSGGFVGVDIFFVISGYLITSIILREIKTDSFCLVDFWARRARRILPAMVVVIIFVLVAGWFLLAPLDYQGLGRAARYQAFFSANIYYWQSAGYFDTASEVKPLLHMWSLAVEEQFYLLFPLICLLLSYRQLKRYKGVLLLLLTTASLLTSIWLLNKDPVGTFYLLPTRAWELLSGALLAYILFAGVYRLNTVLAQWLSVFGLGMLTYAILGLDPRQPFPGVAALLPVVGTVLLIWSNQQKTWVGQLLSTKPLVGIGLISYSLYLWHWPLFAFINYTAIEPVTMLTRCLLVTLSILAAIFSWRFIETPFRRRTLLQANKRLMQSVLASIFILAVCGQLIRKNEGYPLRLPEDALRFAMDREWNKRQKACVRKKLAEIQKGDMCQISAKTGDFNPKMLVWGDSHNGSLMPALEDLSREFDLDMLYAVRSSCLPLVSRYDKKTDECSLFNRGIFTLLKTHKIEHIMLAGRWSTYLYGEENSGEEFIPVLTEQEFKQRFEQMAAELSEIGVTAWIVREVPLQSFDVPVHLTKLALNGAAIGQYGRPLAEHLRRQGFIDNTFRGLKGKHFKTLNPANQLCNNNDYCTAIDNGHSLYKDDNHLSIYGAKYIAPAIMPAFKAIARNEL